VVLLFIITSIVAKLKAQEQHTVLITKPLTLMSNIAAGHCNLRCRAHDKLDAVQFVNVMVQMFTRLGADLFQLMVGCGSSHPFRAECAYRTLPILPSLINCFA